MLLLLATTAALAACRPDAVGECATLGVAAFEAGRTRAARRHLERACAWGLPIDCAPLLVHFDAGWEVVDSWEERCHNGYGYECNEAGRLFAGVGGLGFEDRARAVELYERGCAAGSGVACSNAAWHAERGKGTERSLEHALELHQRACSLRWEPSCLRRAESLLVGRGAPSDPPSAYALLDTRCRAGARAACDTLGEWLDDGRGAPPDRARAVDPLAGACARSEAWACARLVASFHDGVADAARTHAALDRACSAGSIEGCAEIAVLREEGSLPTDPAWTMMMATQPGWLVRTCEAGSAAGCRAAAADASDPLVQVQLLLAAEARAPASPAPVEPIAPAYVPDEGPARACFVRHAQLLASSWTEGRGASTVGLARAADSIDGTLAELGLEVRRQPVEGAGDNVVAVLPGRGGLAGEAVVLGAHYDSFGTDEDGVRWPGADDNASGVAGALCAAEALVPRLAGEPDHRALIVVAFAGEELGLLGSQRYVAEPAVPLDATAAMVNLDMIGRLEGGALRVATHYGPEWPALVAGAAAAVGLPTEAEVHVTGTSDHLSFVGAGVPAVSLGGVVHGDHHQPTDTASRLHADRAAAATRAATALTHILLTGPSPSRPRADACVEWMGPIGIGLPVAWRDVRWRLQVRCVLSGSPADAAGLRAGDLLVGLDGTWHQPEPLIRKIWGTWPGSPLRVDVERDGACTRHAVGREPAPVACPDAYVAATQGDP